MKIALFGGSFDPVHREHMRLAAEAREELGLDRLFFIPSYRAPHKAMGAIADGADRMELLLAACRGTFAEVSDIELQAGGTSYTYLTCRAFREKFVGAELYFLVGADMLGNFFKWREPEDILRNVTLVACGRGEERVSGLHDRFRARFGKDFLELSFSGEEVSSTDLRVAIAFGNREEARRGLPPAVFETIEKKGLYRYPDIEGALGLLTESRRAHSERVARMACARARSLSIPEEKALAAAMLHDCGKYVRKTDPMLQNFRPPEGVPDPVLHQYTGAYLAEKVFGVTDEDILNAVRYHTSGREDMSALEKLIFLSDMLEEGRSFEGIAPLREAFWQDLDLCLYLSLKHQLAYLRAQDAPVYRLTQQAFDWLKAHTRFE